MKWRKNPGETLGEVAPAQSPSLLPDPASRCHASEWKLIIRLEDMATNPGILTDFPWKPLGNYKMRIAVIGAGISGLVSAYVLAKAGVDVVLYEKEASLGGHAKTVTVDDGIDLDLGFMVFNRVTYPNMMEFFESLGVDMEVSDMSFSVSLDNGRSCEWGSRGGLSSLFSQKRNALNPYFWQMIREIFKFKNDVIRYVEDLENNPDIERNETLGQFISSHGYSDLFQKAYLIPMCSSIWSSPSEGLMNFSAYVILSFCRNHHLLQLFGRPQWLTVRCRSQSYVNKVKEELIIRGCQILSGCPVQSVTAVDGGKCLNSYYHLT
ncbi:Cyclopropane-fatty-acyl-phospholipid synthase [Heracleum sosnowskyi]|uniref:Cyclopropane-fatty-acyl-phospholipid synthase n=1 Tax=Heracleum sosnowskyi TaxID=360622 RepID=A0AAD8H8R1_9APIA|nr:Cyclopropane-fatty-acyl-phospholipid synthase [Heracleum sosnowskyi]